MPVLTKNNILDRIRAGGLRFDPPLDGFQIQPHAVDLRLGFAFRLPKTWELTENGREALNIDYLGTRKGDYFEEIQLVPGQTFELLPSEFVIVTTLEEIQMPLDLMTVLYPRTSFNRRGLAVDLSGIIDTTSPATRGAGHLRRRDVQADGDLRAHGRPGHVRGPLPDVRRSLPLRRPHDGRHDRHRLEHGDSDRASASPSTS